MGIWDSLTGQSASAASNAAAQDTYKKQKNATRNITDYGNQYASMYSDLAKQYQPYQQAGNASLSMLMNGLGLNGSQGSTAYTDAYRATPGYQSGLQTGTDAALASANASGRLNSGATLKALQRYGSDYEDQRSQQYLNNLSGVSNQGLTATNSAVNTTGQGLQGQLGTRQSAYQGDMAAAGTIGQGQVAGAQAEQSGLQNLMGTAAYLGGAALGGGGAGTALTNLFGNRQSSYSPTNSYQAAPGNFGTFNWGGQQYSMAR